ncbi:MAG: ftsY [Firmicutes bacterium]|nr:ftsY [Bacillota bacterium]
MGFFDRLKTGLEKTRKNFTDKIDQLISGYATIDSEFLEDLEAVLLSADIGIQTTNKLMASINTGIRAKEIRNPDELRPYLKTKIEEMLLKNVPEVDVSTEPPRVVLVIGVNGVGKTTTIGKLGNFYREKGETVLLAAGDTFRAAAIEQLEIWGKRIGVDVIKQATGSDPAAVAFDAVQAAKARKVDTLIIDTAGRLHTKTNLMEELKKINRVISREIPGAPHEILLVLDATTGQNAISQAKLFSAAAPVTGVVLTKLDGTAKGGVVVSIGGELGLPVLWIGVGEGITDLRPFDPREFADALFGDK